MSLNLDINNRGFGAFESNHGNRQNLTSTDAKAVLYLFKPYHGQFTDVGLRSSNYRFDENFLAGAKDIKELASRGTASAGVMLRDFMSTNNLNDNMFPSITPTFDFQASRLNDNWRFILILTESGTGLIGRNSIGSANNQARRIYTGFFTDEPLNMNSFQRSLNPNAHLVITHKTVVGMSIESGRNGAFTSLNTFASENIVRPSISRDLMGFYDNNPNNDIFLMTPPNCFNSVDVMEDGSSIVVPGSHSKITMNHSSEVIPDLYEQPAHNVATIVKSIIRVQEDNVTYGRLNHQKHNRMFDDDFLDSETTKQKLGRYTQLKQHKSSSIFDLDVDDQISALDLNNLVNGQLDVIPFDIETPMYYDTADQSESSITNQVSFLIASVISPILASAGLNEMAFEYSVGTFRGRHDEDFTTYAAAPCYPINDNHAIANMAKAVEIELSRGIFQTIYDSFRDFHVVVDANATGMTKVRLSLIGMGMRCQQDFEFPSCLGGLVSPLLGDYATNVNNAHEIEGLCGVVINTTPINKTFNRDDHDFEQFALDSSAGYFRD